MNTRHRILRLAVAGAAALTLTALGSGSVRPTDVALPASVGGFATDDDDDQAQLQQQQAQQSMQQAEQQNEQAEQQFEQGMQQAQQDEQQANNP